ncbi:MAG: SixA phosphatase family protein [Acidimicrobiales bacterium]
MLVLLVRHAHAGSKDRWQADDALRPLNERGVAEAAALVGVLSRYAPRQILSSPLLRCVQTVQPLAAHLGLAVEAVTALGPAAGKRVAAFVRGLDGKEGPVVVCTHGETIEALQAHLSGEGAPSFASGTVHEKGSVWLLHTLDGKVTSARYLQPPARAGGEITPSASDH